MAGALALASFVKAGGMVFLGAPRTQPAAGTRTSAGRWMRVPMLALAAVCVAIGLAPVLFWPAVARAVGAWHPAWAAAAPRRRWLTLGAVQLGAAVAGRRWPRRLLWRKARANGLRRAADLGLRLRGARRRACSTPAARSPASSPAGSRGSCGRSACVERPRGLFPASALRLERIPETVLERVIAPGGRRDHCGVSTAVRRLQHGRLQAYILYLVVGLAALGALVVAGRRAMIDARSTSSSGSRGGCCSRRCCRASSTR